MERAKETRFLDSHALLSDHLCVCRAAKENEKKIKIGRGRAGRREDEGERGKCALESNLYT